MSIHIKIGTGVVGLDRTILDEGGNAFRWLEASQHPVPEEGGILEFRSGVERLCYALTFCIECVLNIFI